MGPSPWVLPLGAGPRWAAKDAHSTSPRRRRSVIAYCTLAPFRSIKRSPPPPAPHRDLPISGTKKVQNRPKSIKIVQNPQTLHRKDCLWPTPTIETAHARALGLAYCAKRSKSLKNVQNRRKIISNPPNSPRKTGPWPTPTVETAQARALGRAYWTLGDAD